MKFNRKNQQEDYEDDMLEEYNEEPYEEEDDDTYYSHEEIDMEREKRYEEYQETKKNISNKIKNPFGIHEKLNSLDEQLRYGSSQTKLIFVLGSLLGLVLIAVIFLLIM